MPVLELFSAILQYPSPPPWSKKRFPPTGGKIRIPPPLPALFLRPSCRPPPCPSMGYTYSFPAGVISISEPKKLADNVLQFSDSNIFRPKVTSYPSILFPNNKYRSFPHTEKFSILSASRIIGLQKSVMNRLCSWHDRGLSQPGSMVQVLSNLE